MSIKDFSDAVKSEAYRAWFQRLSRDNVLKTATSELRKEVEGYEFNSFLLTQETIKDILDKLYSEDVPQEAVNKVYNKIKSITYQSGRGSRAVSARALKEEEPYVKQGALYFPRVSFDQINRILSQGFDEALAKNKGKKISDFFQRGHVFGLFPKKVSEISSSLKANQTIDPKNKAMLLELLSNLEKQFEQEDLATSNIKTPEFSLYARYRKKPNKYLVELQLKEVNQAAGQSQALYSRALQKFFNPGEVSFKSGDKAGPMQKILEDNISKLVETKGSPSYLDLIGELVADIIKNGKAKQSEYAIPLIKVGRSGRAKVDTSQHSRKIKEDKAKLKKLKTAVASMPTRPADMPPSYTNLQLILERSIRDAIQSNMGTGRDTKILNYRSGRFADSVKIEKLSQSRAGMITVFYSYMKNPYGTFSNGGVQQYPKSRDPKLLIAKSIREIAAKEAYNNLRSVNV